MAERVRLADIRETAKIAATMPGILPEHIAAVAALEAVLALHIQHKDIHKRPRPINGPWFCCGAVQVGAVEMNDCHECGQPMPCPTRAAIESVIDLGGER